MDFSVFKDRLVADGYSDDAAYAKIAHDIVLKAVQDSGFHDNLTVKGGVVMSSLTDVARRYLQIYIFDDAGMREDGILDIVARIERIFSNQAFMHNVSRPANAWLDVPVEEAAAALVAFISALE